VVGANQGDAMSLLKLVHLLPLVAIALFVVSASGVGEEATISVDCACQTKKNASWCEVNIGDFEEHTYVVGGFRKPGKPLSEGELATFCKRHADAICQCDDVKHFKGAMRP
jgi:hypothetical protein